jgi:endoglucanase
MIAKSTSAIVTFCTAIALLALFMQEANAADCTGDARTFDNGLHWSSEGGRLVLNGCDFHLKGLNWFGFQSKAYAVGGIWQQGVSRQTLIDIMKAEDINAVRLPISLALALNPNQAIDTTCVECAPENKNPNAWEFYSETIDLLGRNGILVMLDMHTLSEDNIAPLWNDQQFSTDQFVQGWRNVIDQFSYHRNVFAIDIKNEPHGPATWGASGDINTDWAAFVEYFVRDLQQRKPDFDKLIFVAGIQGDAGGAVPGAVGPSPYYWGENLEGIRQKPIAAGDWANRIVYTPHCYGPNINDRTWFHEPSFPGNMPVIWDAHFGFAQQLGHTVVPSEWGGLPSSNQWMESFATYLIDRCMTGA